MTLCFCYLNILTSDQRLVDGVAFMDQDRDFTERIDLPQPPGFGHKLTVDHVVLHILGVETKSCPLGVGTEPHIDESHGLLVHRRHRERVGSVVPGIERS